MYSQQEPLLSICIPVYNHENYIEQCLKSVLAQELDFPIEVLVGEDSSSDNTRKILQQLEKDLPQWVHIFYRKKNMGAVKNGEDLYSRARGTYLTDLEGDDFYLWPKKLKTQVDFLETHPDYVATYTNCTVVGSDSLPTGEKYPECKDDEYSFKEFFYWCLPGQSGTMVCRRKEYLEARANFMERKHYDFYPGDRRNAFLFLILGRIRCFQESWGAYRHISKGGSSHSANVHKDLHFAKNEIGFGQTLVEYAEHSGNKAALLVAKKTLYRMRFRWCHGKSKTESAQDILKDILHEPSHRPSFLCVSLIWYAGLALRVLKGRSIIL